MESLSLLPCSQQPTTGHFLGQTTHFRSSHAVYLWCRLTLLFYNTCIHIPSKRALPLILKTKFFVHFCFFNTCYIHCSTFLSRYNPLEMFFYRTDITKPLIMQFSPPIFCCFLIISEYSPRNSACRHFPSNLAFRGPCIVKYS
jgi:hypothetical protein